MEPDNLPALRLVLTAALCLLLTGSSGNCAATQPVQGWKVALRTHVMGLVTLKLCNLGCHLTTELMDIVYMPSGGKDGQVMLVSPEHKTYVYVEPKQFNDRVKKLSTNVHRRRAKGWATDVKDRKPGPKMFGYKTLCIEYSTKFENKPESEFIDKLWIAPDIRVNAEEMIILKQFLSMNHPIARNGELGLPLKYMMTVHKHPTKEVIAVETKSIEKATYTIADFGPPKGYTLGKSDADVLMGVEDQYGIPLH